MENLMNNTEDSFARMQAIFDERERQYNEREEEFKKRRASFSALETRLSAQKQDIEEHERKLAEEEERLGRLHSEKEAVYQERSAELDKREKRIKALEDQLKKDKADFETEKNQAYLKVKLEEEELKNERVKVRRQAEALEYEKEMGNIGVTVIKEDLSGYVARSELETNYISIKEHEQKVAELEETVKALQQAKTDLFRKMFGREKDAPKEQAEGMNVMYGADSGDETEPEPETERQAETERDLTVDSLRDSLLDHTEFSAPQIRHAEEGDLIESSIGKQLKCFFVFSEPPYFDLVIARKAGRRLDVLVDLLKREYPDISFVYENGELRATGYFLRNMQAEALIKEVKQLAGDMEEGVHGR